MKKYKMPTDDLFRESLRDYRMTPSDRARKAFLKEASGLTRSEKRGRRGWFLPALLLLLTGAAWLLFALWGVDDPTAPAAKTTAHPIPGKVAPTTASPSIPATENPDRENPVPGSSGTLSSITSFHATRPAPSTGNNGLATTLIPSPPLPAPPPPAISDAAILPPGQSDPIPPVSGTAEKPDTLFSIPATEITSPTLPVLKSEDPDSNRPIVAGPSATRKPRSFTLSAGGYYAPEWIFNTLDDGNFAHNFGIEGRFRYGVFTLRTGAGLSIARGSNETEVTYHAYLGEYHRLDSIRFTWSTPEQKYKPNMFMSDQEVFDTATVRDQNRVEKRFTYLRIPLVFGYDFWKSERMTAGLRVGPVLSVLLSTRHLSGEYDPGRNRIIHTNDLSPGQLHLNWQATAGLGFSFRITRNLLFDLEPEAAYYFNSAFERPGNNRKPWSAGLRGAILIEL